jgi:hypothetical protein
LDLLIFDLEIDELFTLNELPDGFSLWLQNKLLNWFLQQKKNKNPA